MTREDNCLQVTDMAMYVCMTRIKEVVSVHPHIDDPSGQFPEVIVVRVLDVLP